MTTLLPEPSPVAAPAASHPTPCPSWCKHRDELTAHHFGPTMTAHWSPQYMLTNPRPLPGTVPIVMRAELSQIDEGDETAEPTLYLSGETDIDLSREEADIFIPQMEAFLVAVKVLRRQMG